MREQRFGRIIIASSITVDRNVMGTGVYAASKAYMENLVKTISIENASTGITANCIQLGYMDGGLTYTLSPDFIETIVKSIPAKRLGKPEEIANTIKYLIDTEYVNGSTIKITGGL
jgi:NAD(P)-dependent dehydrogenase (short-subunit alcohol dehydrogenase family)